MHFFRNPEIKRNLLFYAAAAALFTTAVYVWAGLSFAVVMLLASLFFALLHLLTTYFRYRRIRLMCQEIDQALHGNGAIHFSDYSEGELAILKIQIDKLFTRLMEQSEALMEDKQKLASSMAPWPFSGPMRTLSIWGLWSWVRAKTLLLSLRNSSRARALWAS